jgi:hypothetical protein
MYCKNLIFKEKFYRTINKELIQINEINEWYLIFILMNF